MYCADYQKLTAALTFLAISLPCASVSGLPCIPASLYTLAHGKIPPFATDLALKKVMLPAQNHPVKHGRISLSYVVLNIQTAAGHLPLCHITVRKSRCACNRVQCESLSNSMQQLQVRLQECC